MPGWGIRRSNRGGVSSIWFRDARISMGLLWFSPGLMCVSCVLLH
jgi:hypothetical protein